MPLLPYLFFIGLFSGLVGSVIGIGGGIIIVPFLSILLKIPIHLAIGTSIIAVLATSLAASIRFFKKDIINIPLCLLMEIPTTTGSIIGSISVAYLKSDALFIVFGCFAFIAGVLAYIKDRFSKNKPAATALNTASGHKTYVFGNEKPEKPSVFDSEYYDEPTKQKVCYRPKRVAAGSAISLIAGLSSGLLGIGGGVIKVPAMNIIMDVPIKVATATSSYMIGITAVVSSIIYFYNGYINLDITIPAVAGVLIGATLGSFIAGKLKSKYMLFIMLVIYLFIGVLMFLKGFKILNY